VVSKETVLGVASIDAQHEELIDLFNQFEHCIRNGANADAVQDLVQRALACANAHFDHEEDLIERTKYPHADDHKFRHRHMRTELTTLAGDVLTTMTHDPVALEHLKEMREMLLEHIAGPDRELVTHLKAVGMK
jgi:hemerythrin-like metal-binding protein